MAAVSDDRPTLVFVTGNVNKFREIAAFFQEENVPVNLVQKDIDLPELQENYDAIVYDKLTRASKHFTNVAFCVEDTSFYISALNGFPGPYIKWFLKKDGFVSVVESVKNKDNKAAYAECTIGFMDPTMHVLPSLSNDEKQQQQQKQQEEDKKNNVKKNMEKNDDDYKNDFQSYFKDLDKTKKGDNEKTKRVLPKLKRQISLHENKQQNSRLFVGRCNGTIKDLNELEIKEIQNNKSKKIFGFDPCFIPNNCDDNKTFYEMTMNEKQKVSARGQALKPLAKYIKIWAKEKKLQENRINTLLNKQSIDNNNNNNSGDTIVVNTIGGYAKYAVVCLLLSFVAWRVFQSWQ